MITVDAKCVTCGKPIRWSGGPRKCMACQIPEKKPELGALGKLGEVGGSGDNV